MLIERKRIPDKIYYSISEVSKYTGVEPHVLRYWETKFSKLKPKRVGGNQRKYTKNDLELLFVIIDLLYNEGYTLDGAEKKLKEGYGRKNSRGNTLGNSNSPEEVVPEIKQPPPVPQPIQHFRGIAPQQLSEVTRELKSILKMLND